MIQKTFESNGVQYGVCAWGGGNADTYHKLVMANNKGVQNWVGVSVEEYELAKRGFERESPNTCAAKV
jgi:hypothetical protein